jgi:hypothetical protein
LHHCGGQCDGNFAVRIAEIYPEVAPIIYPSGPIAPTPAPVTPTPAPITPVTCQQGERLFEFDLQTDNYGGETSWKVVDSSGATVVALRDGYASNTLYEVKECLPLGSYTFTIYDSYPDGICCQQGNGWYNLHWHGQQIASGGDFGDEISHSFGEDACGDDPNWSWFDNNKKKTRKCNWVSNKPNKRCDLDRKIGNTIVNSNVACRDGCGHC